MLFIDVFMRKIVIFCTHILYIHFESYCHVFGSCLSADVPLYPASEYFCSNRRQQPARLHYWIEDYCLFFSQIRLFADCPRFQLTILIPLWSICMYPVHDVKVPKSAISLICGDTRKYINWNGHTRVSWHSKKSSSSTTRSPPKHFFFLTRRTNGNCLYLTLDMTLQ